MGLDATVLGDANLTEDVVESLVIPFQCSGDRFLLSFKMGK